MMHCVLPLNMARYVSVPSLNTPVLSLSIGAIMTVNLKSSAVQCQSAAKAKR